VAYTRISVIPLLRLKLARCPHSLAPTLVYFTFYLGNPFPRLKLARCPHSLMCSRPLETAFASPPRSLAATPRGFAFYACHDVASANAGRFPQKLHSPDRDVFYLAHPIPRFLIRFFRTAAFFGFGQSRVFSEKALTKSADHVATFEYVIRRLNALSTT
jgi:hypothetical protein